MDSVKSYQAKREIESREKTDNRNRLTDDLDVAVTDSQCKIIVINMFKKINDIMKNFTSEKESIKSIQWCLKN